MSSRGRGGPSRGRGGLTAPLGDRGARETIEPEVPEVLPIGRGRGRGGITVQPRLARGRFYSTPAGRMASLVDAAEFAEPEVVPEIVVPELVVPEPDEDDLASRAIAHIKEMEERKKMRPPPQFREPVVVPEPVVPEPVVPEPDEDDLASRAIAHIKEMEERKKMRPPPSVYSSYLFTDQARNVPVGYDYTRVRETAAPIVLSPEAQEYETRQKQLANALESWERGRGGNTKRKYTSRRQKKQRHRRNHHRHSTKKYRK